MQERWINYVFHSLLDKLVSKLHNEPVWATKGTPKLNGMLSPGLGGLGIY